MGKQICDLVPVCRRPEYPLEPGVVACAAAATARSGACLWSETGYRLNVNPCDLSPYEKSVSGSGGWRLIQENYQDPFGGARAGKPTSGFKRKKVAGVTGAFKVHYLVFPDGPLFKELLQQVIVKAATNINSQQASLHQNGHLLTKDSIAVWPARTQARTPSRRRPRKKSVKIWRL